MPRKDWHFGCSSNHTDAVGVVVIIPAPARFILRYRSTAPESFHARAWRSRHAVVVTRNAVLQKFTIPINFLN